MGINNPYLYHPHPLCVVAAGELCKIIAHNPVWEREFAKGKMLGILVLDNDSYLAAYSGIVNIEPNDVFVPPVYDLNNPDDFYKEEEAKITEINRKIALGDKDSENLKAERKRRSQALQLEIFKHFDFINHKGETKNIIDIFAEAKRGLPPGGAGECAAPRLLQYAFRHRLKPLALAEFWYGVSPRHEERVHREFYPSCIEKCSPILKYMTGDCEEYPIPSASTTPNIIFEDKDIIILDKPSGVLSTPAKDTALFNVETWLHETHPEVKGPMLVHRLDQSTSGLMIAAKNAIVFKTLQAGFCQHKIQKTYIAWVEGVLSSECGLINLPICSNPDDRPRQVVDFQFGKTAVSRYQILKREENRTLIELRPFTGRTHQLRIHCASPFGLNHVINGDRIYSIINKSCCTNRLLLHAAKLSFVHPVTNKNLEFISSPEF